MGEDQDDVVRSLTELLAIAKVAMPDFLFAIDPRVHRARQLVASRAQVPGGRPPSVLAMPRMEMVDLSPPPAMADVDRMSAAEPPWDITAGLDAFIASDLAPPTRTEAVILILRDWLIGHRFIEPVPDGEQQH